MAEVEIFQDELKQDGDPRGKIAIIRGGLQTDDPTSVLDDAVRKYVGKKSYNQFVEIHMDNPWVRVIITGINELDYEELTDQKIDD